MLPFAFECSSVHPDCEAIVGGETHEEVLEKAEAHMKDHHGLIELPRELTQRVLNSVRPDSV